MTIFRQENEDLSNNSIERGEGYTSIPTKSKKFFKENYIKAMEFITPPHYFEGVEYLSEGNVRETERLINSHILFANSVSTALPISSITGSVYLNGINTFSGISQYFVKQNNLTRIGPASFQENILYPQDKSFSLFKDKDEFKTYLSSLLPTITCYHQGNQTNFPAWAGATNAIAHENLTKALSWLYFLNRADPVYVGSGYSTSGEIINLLADKLTANKSISLSDCLKVLNSYLWYNYYSEKYSKPELYASGVGEFVSGTQQLDNIKTLIETVYSPHGFDSDDFKVRDAFIKYSNFSNLFTEKVNDSSFYRFMEAISFYMADANSIVHDIDSLTDIDTCPDEFLPYLADLIGWEIIGYEPFRWRGQLKNAIEVYKTKGTRKSVQLMLDMIFGGNNINFDSNNLITFWESYLPNLIFYALVTESSLFFDGNGSFTNSTAISLGISEYNTSSVEANIRSCVDKILLELFLELPNNFNVGNRVFPGPYFSIAPEIDVSGASRVWNGSWNLRQGEYYTGFEYTQDSKRLELKNIDSKIFKYRNKETSFPPFEEERFFLDCSIDNNLLNLLYKKLQCFGVREGFARDLKNFVNSKIQYGDSPSGINKGFLLFAGNETFPPNYSDVVTRINKGNPDPVNYLSLWSGKSSHFKVIFNASSFDFSNAKYGVSSSYALSKIFKSINFVAPAHAIPDYVIYSTSSETVEPLNVATYPEVNINPLSHFDGSGQLANNYIVSSWSMSAVSNNFKYKHVIGLSGSIFSGEPIVARRNTLRRRDFRHILDRGGYVDRSGRGVFGYLPLSGEKVPTQVNFSSILGYIPSAMEFESVPLKQNSALPMMNLLNTSAMSKVWSQCENYNSSSTYFGISTSSTYPCRGLNFGNSVSAMVLRSRDELSDIMALQHRVLYKEKMMQAYNLVSAHFLDVENEIIDQTAVFPASTGILPSSVSSWVGVEDINLVVSLANHLEEKTISDISTNKYDNFKFGNPLHKLYREYTSNYTGALSSLNTNGYNNLGFKPNIINHIFGPYIYNANLYTIGNAAISTPRLISSSIDAEVDISYGGGQGFLSQVGGATGISGTNDLFIGRPEFHHNKIVDNIVLIDSSGIPGDFLEHKIFSVFKYPASSLTTVESNAKAWDRDDTFVDNLAIKYTRPKLEYLPRVRIPINPTLDENRNNFFLPNHKYRLKIKAANIDFIGDTIGGDNLSVLITTEPMAPLPYNSEGINKLVWVYEGNKWNYRRLEDLQSNRGITDVTNNIAMYKQFPISNATVVQPKSRNTCISYKPNNSFEEEDVTIPKVTNEMFKTLEFEFDTINPTGNRYYNFLSPVNTTNTIYNIDIFLKAPSKDRFVIFDSFSIEDITNKENAIIQTNHGNYELTKKELQTCLKYFNDLRRGIASRDSTITSSIMDVSGGSRASYRVNYNLLEEYINTVGTNQQIVLYNIRD